MAGRKTNRELVIPAKIPKFNHSLSQPTLHQGTSVSSGHSPTFLNSTPSRPTLSFPPGVVRNENSSLHSTPSTSLGAGTSPRSSGGSLTSSTLSPTNSFVMLRDTFKTALHQLEGCVSELSTLTEENRQLTESLTEERKRSCRLELEKENEQLECDKLKKEKNNLQKERDKMKMERDEFKQSLEASSKQCDELMKECGDLRKRCEEHQTEKNSLLQRIDAYENHRLSYSATSGASSSRINGLNNSFSEQPMPSYQVPEGSHLLTIEALVEFVPDMTSIWDLLGYGLGMRTEVDNQKVGQGGTTQSRCLAVLQAWLEQCRDASWEKLLTMIWKLEKRNLADRIYNSIRTTT